MYFSHCIKGMFIYLSHFKNSTIPCGCPWRITLYHWVLYFVRLKWEKQAEAQTCKNFCSLACFCLVIESTSKFSWQLLFLPDAWFKQLFPNLLCPANNYLFSMNTSLSEHLRKTHRGGSEHSDAFPGRGCEHWGLGTTTPRFMHTVI